MDIMSTIKFVIFGLMSYSLVCNKLHGTESQKSRILMVSCEPKILHVNEISMKFKLLVMDSWACLVLLGGEGMSPVIIWDTPEFSVKPSQRYHDAWDHSWFLFVLHYTHNVQIKLIDMYAIFNTVVWFSWVKIMQFYSCVECIPTTYYEWNFMPLVHRTHRNKIKISHCILRTSISASNRRIHY